MGFTKKTTMMTALALAVLAGASGCGKKEIPEKLRGSFKVSRMLLGVVTVVVEANQLRTPDCKINCGVEVLPLTSIACSPVINPTKCEYKSEHCTGVIELDAHSNKVSISADVVPGATGDQIAIRNMTCAQISGNDLDRT
jgi:hypothetical protein